MDRFGLGENCRVIYLCQLDGTTYLNSLIRHLNEKPFTPSIVLMTVGNDSKSTAAVLFSKHRCLVELRASAEIFGSSYEPAVTRAIDRLSRLGIAVEHATVADWQAAMPRIAADAQGVLLQLIGQYCWLLTKRAEVVAPTIVVVSHNLFGEFCLPPALQAATAPLSPGSYLDLRCRIVNHWLAEVETASVVDPVATLRSWRA